MPPKKNSAKQADSEKLFFNRLRNFFDDKVDSWFEWFILSVVLINAISLGLETTNLGVSYPLLFKTVDIVTLAIYCAELVLRIIVFNKEFFFKTTVVKKSDEKNIESETKERKWNLWNIFDSAIVLISLLNAIQYLTVFRVFRILRAVRITKVLRATSAVRLLKVATGLRNLRKILFALINSLSGIVWTGVLLFLFFYIYAVIGTNLFAVDFPTFFSTIGKSFFTLCQIMTFDAWGDITRDVASVFPWAWLYFVSFGLITGFVMINIIVGIVVDSIEQARKRDEEMEQYEEWEKNISSAQYTEDSANICSKMISKEQLYEEITLLRKEISCLQESLNKGNKLKKKSAKTK